MIPTAACPSETPKPMRIVCPSCLKPTKSHLISGWVLTWCKKCHQWFKTINEKISDGEIGHLLMFFIGVVLANMDTIADLIDLS